MAEAGQKTKKYESVRIWAKQKERLEKLMANKLIKKGIKSTEVELASEAIDALCTKEEKKLGL